MTFYLQPHSCTLVSYTPGDAVRRELFEIGLCWTIVFDADKQDRLRSHMQGIYCLFIIVGISGQGGHGMGVYCKAKAAPQIIAESMLTRGNNMSTIH